MTRNGTDHIGDANEMIKPNGINEAKMSMSTHVIGFKPPDERWQKMKEAWDACVKAKVEPPKSVTDFFNDEEPDSAGVEVEIPTREWRDDSREGYEVSIDALPEGVKIIRFYNSW